VLPLALGISPDSSAFSALLQQISTAGNHSRCGIVGVTHILQVLADGNRGDLALALAKQTSWPSWGYMISQGMRHVSIFSVAECVAKTGATTMWESWNGTFYENPGGASRNHIMFGGGIGSYLLE
jgi:alpha-L-rhamnosidase